jgi:hypothetical protein
VTSRTPALARALTNALNPFFIFTALYAFVAFAEAAPGDAVLYLAVELLAAAAVAGFVLFMRRRSRVGTSGSPPAPNASRLPVSCSPPSCSARRPALLDAREDLFLLTLSMGLASATVALISLVWKASAHCTVAGHATAAGLLLLGPLGVIFLLALPLVAWSRVVLAAHTLPQALAGMAVGIGFASLFLV